MTVHDDVTRTMVDFLQMKSFADDPLVLTDGDGIRVVDVEDRWYIDGLSGTFCASLGHGNAALADAGAAQLRRLAMAAPTMATNDRALELVDRLLGLLPADYTVAKLLSGGSEATESAMKIARQYHKQTGDAGRYKILSHYRSYHGATGHAVAASGWPVWRAPYEPLAGGFIHLHTPDPFRPPFDVAPEAVAATYLRLVEETIELEDPRTIAALITEPVLMSAGVVVPPDGYLPGLRALCDRHGILLIFDEIITAFGRLGAMFAAELFRTWPDILCVGKGLSGGYAPLSAVVLARRVADAFWGEPRDLVQFHSGHTYGANPVACAIGLAAIDQLVRDDLAANAVAQGDRLRAGLRGLRERHPWIGDVRGLGLLVGVEFVADHASRARFPAEAAIGTRVRDAARRRGLLLRASHWMLVLAPPLTIRAAEVDEIIGILDAALGDVEAAGDGLAPGSGSVAPAAAPGRPR
ncbi:MAG: aminotransferase class III-fold pyridoxal phosphate-dependent enzyme [Chloroflexi bacterium]|nr:aminotransferase class III-fold pyridoxal phosphate-dependent enzyme [Chloroflexota bacterium]